MMGTQPFKQCPACGTPELEDAPHALVLYFTNKADRAEFVEVFKEAKPNVQTYSYSPPDEGDGTKGGR